MNILLLLIDIGQPEAIFFVPVAAEFNEDLVIEVMKHLMQAHRSDESYPSSFFLSFLLYSLLFHYYYFLLSINLVYS